MESMRLVVHLLIPFLVSCFFLHAIAGPTEQEQLLTSVPLTLRRFDDPEHSYKTASFDGPTFRMSDGSSVETKVIDSKSSIAIAPFLSRLQQDSVLNGKRAIVFDVEWDVECIDADRKKCQQHPSAVKLSTINLCLFIKLRSLSQNNLRDLCQFFASKSVTFVGVHIEEDLSLLRDTHGIVIRTAVDPREFAAKVRGVPALEYLAVRELAHKVLWYDMSRLDSIQSHWDETGSNEHLEAAAIEGWLAFKVWDQITQ